MFPSCFVVVICLSKARGDYDEAARHATVLLDAGGAMKDAGKVLLSELRVLKTGQ